MGNYIKPDWAMGDKVGWENIGSTGSASTLPMTDEEKSAAESHKIVGFAVPEKGEQ